MLQRQIMFKQLQELQRRQQFQEIGDTRNQNYVNRLSSLKQSSGFQSPFTVNGTPIQDSSQMYIVDNTNMSQHGEPDGLVLSQSHSLALGPIGPSQQNFDMSMHGSHVPNSDKNFNQYSQLQGPSEFPVHLMPNSNYGLGATNMQSAAYGNLFSTQQFALDHNSMPDGSLLPNQEKTVFGQVPSEGYNSGILSGNYSQQGIPGQKIASLLDSEGEHQNPSRDGLSPGKTQKLEPSQNSATLDPLEQKILYSTDDNIWESFGASARASTGGLDGSVDHTSDTETFPSLQSGSWSALMQSAVAESSSTDTKMQEEWSGLGFQNPEPLNDAQPSNFTNSEKQQYNWYDRNLQNASSLSSEAGHSIQNFNVNYNFHNSLQPGLQPLKQKEEYQSDGSAPTQHSPRTMRQLAETSFSSPDVWSGQQKVGPSNDNQSPNNFSGSEFRGALCLQENSSRHAFGTQKPYDQVNQLNMQMHSREQESMTTPAETAAVSTRVGVPLDFPGPGDSVTAQSESIPEQHNKDDMSSADTPAVELNAEGEISKEFPLSQTSLASFAKPSHTSPVSSYCGFRLRGSDQAPQAYSFSPLASYSSATSLPGHNVNDHITNQHPAPPVPGHLVTEFPEHSVAASQDNSAMKITHSSVPDFPLPQTAPLAQPSLALLQQMGFQIGQTAVQTDVAPRQDVSNLFQPPGPGSGYFAASPNEQQHESEKELGTYSGNSEHNAPQLDKGSLGRDQETVYPARDNEALHDSVNQHYSLLHQAGASRNAEIHGNKNIPLRYDSVNYPQSVAHGKHMFMSQQKSVLGDGRSVANASLQSVDISGWNPTREADGDQSGKPSPMAYNKNFQRMSVLDQNDTANHSIGNNDTSNMAYQSQISLQMAPSWFKQYGTLKNEQTGPMTGANAATSQAQPFSQMIHENSLVNGSIMQLNLASHVRESNLWTSTSCKQPNPSNALQPDVTCQKLNAPISKKRKLVALDMIPWHKEVNNESSSLLDMSEAELQWVLTLNRRPQEVPDEVEIAEEISTQIRAKRRLISTTQLMQQVFTPAPAVILCSDASSSFDSVAYSSSRVILGDVCRATVYQLPSNTNELSPGKIKAANRTNVSKFSNVAEGFENQVKKLEENLVRLDKSLSLVDIKLEIQELEKFAILNRFAKFHFRAHPSSVNPASPSGTSTLHKTNPQRYVIAVPIPKILPEGVDCLSL